MKKELYRVYYLERQYHRGETYTEIQYKVVKDSLENIKKKFNIYYLTDVNGDVIIDNRK